MCPQLPVERLSQGSSLLNAVVKLWRLEHLTWRRCPHHHVTVGHLGVSGVRDSLICARVSMTSLPSCRRAPDLAADRELAVGPGSSSQPAPIVVNTP
jgi:hypothetical protein